MSETFPFAAGDEPDDDAGSARRRPLLLAAGGLGVAALAVLGVLALSGPGEDELGLGLPAGAPAAAATPGPATSPTVAPAPGAAEPASTGVRRGRDPFLGPATGGATGETGAGTAGEGAAPAPAAPAPEAPLAAPADGGSPAGAPDPAPATGGELVGEQDGRARQVSLVRVAEDQTAVLAVDGASETVRVGDAFGPAGALLLLSLQQGPEDGQWTAVVQRGSGDPFDVVSGQPATLA